MTRALGVSSFALCVTVPSFSVFTDLFDVVFVRDDSLCVRPSLCLCVYGWGCTISCNCLLLHPFVLGGLCPVWPPRSSCDELPSLLWFLVVVAVEQALDRLEFGLFIARAPCCSCSSSLGRLPSCAYWPYVNYASSTTVCGWRCLCLYWLLHLPLGCIAPVCNV